GAEGRGDGGEFVEELVVENVHLVGKIEPATDRGLAITERIPRETEARTEFVFREFRGFERRRMNLSDDRGAARAVFFLVVEEASVVFPARAAIDRTITANTPVITYVPGKPLIVVSAVREPVRRRDGEESILRA